MYGHIYIDLNRKAILKKKNVIKPLLCEIQHAAFIIQ